MKRSVSVQNQIWFDKQRRMEKWRALRLRYLRSFHPQYYEWLEKNGVHQAHLIVLAEEADDRFRAEMGRLFYEASRFKKKRDPEFLRLYRQRYHAACKTAEEQVLYQSPQDRMVNCYAGQ